MGGELFPLLNSLAMLVVKIRHTSGAPVTTRISGGQPKTFSLPRHFLPNRHLMSEYRKVTYTWAMGKIV